MNFLKQLVCVFSFLLCIISCDIITPNNEYGNIDWSKGDYAFIDMENYPEWESGIITKDDYYLLVKNDSTNYGYIGYINSRSFKSDGIALYFNENLELLSFVTNKGICYINRNDEDKVSILIVTDNESTIFEDLAIRSMTQMRSLAKFPETRSSTEMSILKGVAEGVSTMFDIGDLVEGTGQLLDGNWNDSNLNFQEILTGPSIKNPFKGLALDASFKTLEEILKALDQMGQIVFLGDCQIAIRQTKIGLKNFRLDVTVSGFESLPPVDFKNGQTKSIPLAGIAINQLPHMTYSANERIIQTWVVDGNGTKSFEFELPKEVTYYATPYLLPTDGQTRFPSFIRYGNTITLPYFNGFINEFKQQSYSENGDKYTFKCHAHAIYNPKDDEFWKLYYEDDNGEKVFFDAKTYEEPSITAPNSAEFEFEIELESNLFKDGKKDIKLGIATFTKSYFIMLASDPQIFELSTEVDRWIDLGLPSGILWAAYNVGATSPEEYGDYYAWGDTEIRSHFGGKYYVHIDPLTGDFINIGENICATEYDVANIKWGDGARMPRVEDIEELINNCSWTIRKLNSITGMHITGSNGNVIFLPFSGDEDSRDEPYGSLNEGYIWSCTRSATESDEAHALNYDDDGIICTCIYDRDRGFTIRPVKDKETDTENL